MTRLYCILLWDLLRMFFLGKVTFGEFAQDVIDTWSSGIPLNPHWRPQYQICHPCYIKYDFIGRFENLNDEASQVLAKLTASGGQTSNVTFPFKNAYRANVPLSKQREKFYANISRDTIRKLISIYRIDYKLCDYDYHWACSDCLFDEKLSPSSSSSPL